MERFHKWKEWSLARTGWQRALLLFIAGAVSSAALAPYHAWPLLFLTFPYFLLQLETGSVRQTSWTGFWFGYGFTVLGTYWIAMSLLVDATQFGWLFPFCVFGLSAIFSIYYLLFGYLFAKLRTTHRFTNIALFTILWVAIEYLRSYGMFGFPWNLMGYALMPFNSIAQFASIAGTFALSLVIVFAVLAPLYYQRKNIVVALLVFLIAAQGYGMWRKPAVVEMTETRLRLVQPNISQDLKWTNAGKDKSMRVHSVLTNMITDTPTPDMVIWSETAFPFTLADGTGWYREMRYFAPQGGYFVTGAIRAHREKIWNTLFVTNDEGQALDYYDKHQLVPFGEFVPLRSILPLNKITPGMIDFSRGKGISTITLKHIPPFSPLICYEVIFPWLAARRDDRPEWILNITNDAWYGDTPGPYQHFEMTRMRAIEQGLPLARVANTGISALIDPYGRALKILPLNQSGVIDHALPKALTPTLYARLGEAPMLMLLGLMSVAYLYYRRGLSRS